MSDDAVGRPDLWARLCSIGLQPREVEQVVDQAFEPPRLDVDRLKEVLAIGRAKLERRARETVNCRAHRGERRAEVVADRPEERGLDRVASAQALGLDSLESESLAILSYREDRRERGEDTVERVPARLESSPEEDASDGAIACLEVECDLVPLRSSERTELDSCALGTEDLSRPRSDSA